MNLSKTTKKTLEKIKEAEKDGRFHEHIDKNVCTSYFKIDETFSYTYRLNKKIAYFFLKNMIVKPYEFIANHFWLKTKIIGKSNLDGISTGAIITCNHINKLDSLVIGYALRKRKIHFTTLESNNMKCRLGSYMRAYGIFPIPEKKSMLKKFQDQLEIYLRQGDWVNFFPEAAEWWCYEKPRPYEIGAFHFAAKFMVPIVPLFITFKKTGKMTKEGIENREFFLHILRPIYPKHSLSLKENKEYLKKQNEEAVWNCYQAFYK